MKVLVAHNRYREPGGEDLVFEAECALLEERGHDVVRYVADNDQLPRRPGLRLGVRTVWNRDAYRAVRRLLVREQPAIAHFHNTFPLISPAAYHAARAVGVPVIQTLHNYRLLCPSAQFFRDGRVCEDCLGRVVPWPGVLHACYRDSRPASAAVATMLSTHRLLGTWHKAIDRYIALSPFARDKFIEGGLPAERIVIKPNVLSRDPGLGEGRGGYALFAGRLTSEKGVEVLLAAWERPGGGVPLTIVGDGPLAGRVRDAATRLAGVQWLGQQSREAVFDLMRNALCLVFPSVWYEGFPLVLLEAMAMGVPVVASNLGTMSSLVLDGQTGFHVQPGDAADLRARVEWLAAHPVEREAMRSRARLEFETTYSAERNYEMLMRIYATARKGRREESS